MNHNKLIENTIKFVKQELNEAESGHDWFHIERVFKTAMYIAKHEGGNLLVVQLGSLLHDIADSKFHCGDEEKGPQVARLWKSNKYLPALLSM
jgi:uncharacterized protein